MPSAQPVAGADHASSGPPSVDERGEGYKDSVTLEPHGALFVWYSVTNYVVFGRARCKPTFANGVILGLKGVGTWYFPISRRGSTDVGTKLASTSVQYVAVVT